MLRFLPGPSMRLLEYVALEISNFQINIGALCFGL